MPLARGEAPSPSRRNRLPICSNSAGDGDRVAEMLVQEPRDLAGRPAGSGTYAFRYSRSTHSTSNAT